MPKAIPHTFNGETLVLSQWASRYGIKIKTLKNRIDSKKWSLKKALESPVIERSANNLGKRKQINKGIKMYIIVMRKYYHKRHRVAIYQQLKIDFEDIQRMKKAA